VESIVGGGIQSLTVLKTDLVNDTTTVEVRYSRAPSGSKARPAAPVEAAVIAETSAKAGVR
jgi:hypothetical protein